MRRALLPLALAICPAGLAQVKPSVAPRPLAEFSAAIEQLATAASPAVVQINVRALAPLEDSDEHHAGYVSEQRATGSGVILDASGYIITNAHVVAGARRIEVVAIDRTKGAEGHRHYPAAIVGRDQATDLAVIKIDAKNLPTLEFVDSDGVRQGQIVVALGSPLGLENSLSVGFISAAHRRLRSENPMSYIQTDAPINPGNSGGPLLDIEGRIAGINTLILSQSGGSEGIGFAIPANTARQVYRMLRKDGRIRRGSIGVVAQDITPQLAAALGLDRETGIILSDVLPHGAAEAAGVESSDIVLAIDGSAVKQAHELSSAVFRRAVGDEMKLTLLRRGERIEKTAVIMERPHQPGDLAQLASRERDVVRRLGILALTVDEKITPILTDLRRLYGVAVAAIPAEFAGFNPGLQPGDVIYELNGRRIASLDELRTALDAKKTGDAVALLVEREGELIFIAFDLQ